MDLGATICKPKVPSCDICPWENHCDSRKAGTSKYLPRKVKKTKNQYDMESHILLNGLMAQY